MEGELDARRGASPPAGEVARAAAGHGLEAAVLAPDAVTEAPEESARRVLAITNRSGSLGDPPAREARV